MAVARLGIFRILHDVINDALYRGSLILLTNTVVTSAIGFLFWTLSAHAYSASTVGIFSGVTSGVGLLAAIAALGLPNTMIRHITTAENPRGLVLVGVAAIATVGAVLCLLTVLALGPHLPSQLHLQQRYETLPLLTALVGVTAVSGTLDACLIATRSSHVLLIKNVVGSLVKVVGLLLLVRLRSSGLLISYGLGLLISTGVSAASLGRQLGGRGIGLRSSSVTLRGYISFTSGNYLATVMGILPFTVVPLEVLFMAGAAETARFAVAFLIVGFLNLIPATVAQVMFAEASRQGVALGTQLRKALRGVYGLLVPAMALTVAAAPLLLRLFGPAYAAAAAGCLRVLSLSTLLTGGTYLVDSMLIARDRTSSYVFMNGVNAALVLGCVGVLLPRGLTAASCGWALGQGLSLIIGLVVLAGGKQGRHHLELASGPSRGASRHPPRDLGSLRVVDAFETPIRELLGAWPMMPTMMIADKVGWDQPTQILRGRVADLRVEYARPHGDVTGNRHFAGEIAECGLWFPPVEVPVGFEQVRSGQRLPVVTIISAHSRWQSAMLVPSRHPNDLLAGWWKLLERLGAVPKILTWDINDTVGDPEAEKAEVVDFYHRFCLALGAECVTGRSGDHDTRELIERAHADLERSFLRGREFASPSDFNAQLLDWLSNENARSRPLPYRSPIDVISIDRHGMLPLPSVSPSTGWHLSLNVGRHPFLEFDSNAYSVHPAVIGRQVELLANLKRVRVVCDGRVAADHERAWTRNRRVVDPQHAATGAKTGGK